MFGLGPNGVRTVPLWLAFVKEQMFGLGPNGVRAVPLRRASVKKQIFGFAPNGVRSVPLWLASVKENIPASTPNIKRHFHKVGNKWAARVQLIEATTSDRTLRSCFSLAALVILVLELIRIQT